METIPLTEGEQYRYDIIHSCIEKDITNNEASRRLGVTVRQIQKLKQKVVVKGRQGVRHSLSGMIAHNATKDTVVTQVKIFLKQKNHRDFGPTFAKEKLAKHGVVLSTETIRSIMTKQNLWIPHKRKGPSIHREWRERMDCFGALVQFDGSYHDWLETGKETCLLASIDDATGKIVRAVFEENEGILACFRFWRAYVELNGRPVAIYLDKFSTYKVNHKNAVDNAEMLTQFERAMKALDIRVICANSPEAKGRVERLFGTLQDRLVKELRLAGVRQRDDANIFLAKTYLPDHNKRFSVQARKASDAHRPLSLALRKDLSSIFSIQSPRKVNNDYTLQWKTKWFQLNATQPTAVYKRDQVTIEEWLDGSIHIRLKSFFLAYSELPERPAPMRIQVTALTREKPTWKPPANHPWRNMF